ncbi:IS200/IS605 family transposase [Bacillus thuringiensis]
MKLDSNNHSVFLLYYHLVLVVKYRRNVFDDMSEYAKDMFVRLFENYNITLAEWNHDVDHVHILFKAHPNTEMTKFINAYKSASSRLMKRDFPQVKKKLWKEKFWSRRFCLLTTGGSPIDVVKTYIENQSEK